MRSIRILVCVAGFLVLLNLPAFGQGGGSTSPLIGRVVDQSGGVIAGVEAVVKNTATGAEFTGITAADGVFTIPALSVGTYTVTISAPGFKQVVVENVKVEAGVPANVRVTLQIGDIKDTVTVTGGAEVVQSHSATISDTMVVDQIARIPMVTRNALDFAIFLPGVTTATNTGNSTVMGLPQTAINITIDGVNVNENYNKTNDGMYARVRPSTDSTEEVTVSTASLGAEASGQGAVQIRFTTRRGTNEFHGSVYEFHRNPVLNANYWFNNRDLPPDPRTGKAPRDRVLQNQFGARIGGPIIIPGLFNGRDKAFFFINMEEFRLPVQITRNRTVFNPLTQQGLFRYNVTVGGQTQVRQVDLLSVAAARGQTATIDPVIRKLLADISQSTTKTGGLKQLTDPNLQQFTFTNSGMYVGHFPTSRLDFNLTKKHTLELTYNFTENDRHPDVPNGVDPRFPGFPNLGSYIGYRFSAGGALRSSLTPRLVNELRMGLSGGTVYFNPENSPATFSGDVANQMGYALVINAAGIDNAYVTSSTQSRNAPTRVIEETLSWVKGSHNLSFGTSYNRVGLWHKSRGYVVPTINFSVHSTDPAMAMFNTTDFPGAAAADLTRAQNIYAVLTGRVTAINANAYLNEETNKYEYIGERIQRGRVADIGLFAQDSWRVRPDLSLTYGLRYELNRPFIPLNDTYTTASAEDLYGISGPGNLFKPGILKGRDTQFIQYKQGVKAYAGNYNDFAPSFGFAWSPNVQSGWLKKIFSRSGATVLRGGYSLAYNRNGMADFVNIFGNNPGSFVTATRSMTIGNLVTGTGSDSLPLLLRQTGRFDPPSFPSVPTYPITGAITNSVNVFDPHLQIPYSQSWSLGIQREITKNIAFEIRYVGTRNIHEWETYNLNEVNIVENGMLDEFKLAMDNLQANIAAGRGGSFRYAGPGTGTSPLPITLAYFSSIPAAQAGDSTKYNSTLFSNTTFVNPLAQRNPTPASYASNLYADATRRDNALKAGLPPNFFLVNPGLQGGVNVVGNGGITKYDSMVMEVRRRMAGGLLFQANYTWAKAFNSSRVSLRVPRVNTQGTTESRGIALTHALKVNWVYNLPFGRYAGLGKGAGPWLRKLISDWEFQGTGRIQSGQPLDYGSVNLVGMTRKELRDAFGLNFDDANRVIYALPKDIIDNTIRAFSVSATSSTGYGALGPPTGRYIAPANSKGCIQFYNGQCAPVQTLVTGPMFTRFDLSVSKRIFITERVNFECRGEFLNAFNNTNFYGSTNLTNFSNPLFGQITSAYRDTSTTRDPGGRQIQLVARINF